MKAKSKKRVLPAVTLLNNNSRYVSAVVFLDDFDFGSTEKLILNYVLVEDELPIIIIDEAVFEQLFLGKEILPVAYSDIISILIDRP